ncbi:MAG: inorganic phosphate transporter [Candidatus Margulisbacteria bacterium]|nr:inorganic phosphate transporter [Candidatus Margulisiibacteriota bacterium]
MLYLVLIISVVFFTMNMGGSNIAPAFAAIFGAKLINHKKAVFLFTVFVLLGGILLGYGVVNTLGGGIIPKEFMNFNVVLIILLSSALGLFVANLLRVPESTSWTTVFAISGVGLALDRLNYSIYYKIIPFWVILPLLSFGITYFIYKIIYPPRKENLFLYQTILSRGNKIKTIALFSSLYIAFAAGTNNVANAVGPLAGAGILSPFLGLILIGPLFGLGGLVFGKRIMSTVGKEIVPLGLISASLVSLVTASLLILASALGIPQSLVQLQALSVMAIGSVKHENHIFRQEASRRIFFAWAITPMLAFLLGFIMTKVFIGG